jgi:hypothetical protein
MVIQQTLLLRKIGSQTGPTKVQMVGASWNNEMMWFMHFMEASCQAQRVTFNFGHTHTQTIIGEFGESQAVASGHLSGVWQGRCSHGNSILDPSIGIDCTPW